MTLILSRRDIKGLMAGADWLAAVETGFRAAAEGLAESPPPMHLHGDGGAFHAKGASIRQGRHYVALKLNGNFPGNPERNKLPTIQGAILLCDGKDGRLLAILDSIEVTLRRTAAATALAAKFLARPESATILICGCGDQGAAQLAALRDVLPLSLCLAWDKDPAKAEGLKSHGLKADGLEVRPVGDLAEAARQSDVVVACTSARTPYLEESFIGPGTFVAAVGADSPDKNEIAPGLMAKAMVVADVTEQCALMGDLNHAIRAGAMRRDEVWAELAQLVAGARTGRKDAAQITLFDSTGTALQDVASAALIYERAMASGGHADVALGEG